jgi:hypothetical protein
MKVYWASGPVFLRSTSHQTIAAGTITNATPIGIVNMLQKTSITGVKDEEWGSDVKAICFAVFAPSPFPMQSN